MKSVATSLSLASFLILGGCQALSPTEDEIALCRDEISRLASVDVGDTSYGTRVSTVNGARTVTINFVETASVPGFTCTIAPDGTKTVVMFRTLTEPQSTPA